MKYITELHDKYKDQPIWIAGAGPSVDTYPDDFMDGKLAITLHNAYLKFPDTQFRHANELDRVKWFKENRPEYLARINIFAWPFYGRTQRQTEEIVNPEEQNNFWFILRPHSRRYKNVDWIEQKIIQVRKGKTIDFGGYGSCLHACIYVCILMGCNPINIIGCEHKAEPGKPEYFKKAQEASVGLFKRDHAKLGKIQEPGTLALIEACKRQKIKVNRYRYYEIVEGKVYLETI